MERLMGRNGELPVEGRFPSLGGRPTGSTRHPWIRRASAGRSSSSTSAGGTNAGRAAELSERQTRQVF
jgi:hypothetical protein